MNEDALPRLYSAASASRRLGCDPATVNRNATPSAVVVGMTEDQTWPLYSEDDLANMTVTEHMRRRARRSA